MKGIHVFLIIAGIGAGLYYLYSKSKSAAGLGAGGSGGESIPGGNFKGFESGNGSFTDSSGNNDLSAKAAYTYPAEPEASLYADSFFSRLNYLGEQKNPITGDAQAVFVRTDREGTPAGASFNVDGKRFFIEQVPEGAASGSSNVVLLPKFTTGFHEVKGSTKGPISPGDPGYDANLERVRKQIQDARTGSNSNSKSSSANLTSRQKNILKNTKSPIGAF